jgi:hypothetical protein
MKTISNVSVATVVQVSWESRRRGALSKQQICRGTLAITRITTCMTLAEDSRMAAALLLQFVRTSCLVKEDIKRSECIDTQELTSHQPQSTSALSLWGCSPRTVDPVSRFRTQTANSKAATLVSAWVQVSTAGDTACSYSRTHASSH